MLNREFITKILYYFYHSKVKKLILIPLILTFLLYAFIIWFLFWANDLFSQYILSQFVTDTTLLGVWSLVITVVTMIFSFFLLIMTFVFFYTFVGMPFFEKISEFVLQEEKVPMHRSSLSVYLLWFAKKLIFLLLMSVICILCSFIPVVNIIVSGLVISWNFLDIPFSLKQLSHQETWQIIKGRWFFFAFIGAIWSFFLAVPIVNLIAYPLGVVVYTLIAKEYFKARV